MSSEEPGTDERWQELMRSMDPVANMNALASVWRDAASSSERVVESFVGGTNDGEPSTDGQTGPTGRDIFVDFERSVDQVAEAAKRFFAQMPFGLQDQPAPGNKAASVAVLDGVGTTEISLPGSEPWATDLVGHDGQGLSSECVTLRRTATVEEADSGHQTTGDGCKNSFIVKVLVPEETLAGMFHGQILLAGDEGFVLPLTVRVHEGDE